MNIRGYFMLLMSTIWRTVVTQLLATFRYRVAGGSDNSSLPESNGRAVIDTIYGNTIKWNQLVQNGDFSNGTTGWSQRVVNIMSVTDGVCSLIYKEATYNNQIFTVASIVSGHKYYASVDIRRFTESNRFLMAASNIYGDPTTIIQTNVVGRNSVIWTSSADKKGVMIYSGYKGVVDSEAFAFTNLQIIDLTAIGIDNLTTTDEVEAWLALNVGQQDYYPYDEGSLISFKGQGVKSVGFNQLNSNDEVLNGLYTWANGTFSPGPSFRCCVSYNKCFPSTVYYLYHTAIYWYDINKNYLGSSGGVIAGSTVTSPANARYFRWATSIDYYPNKCCINLSDPAKNGTYEPYKEEIVDLSGAYINVWDEVWKLGSLSYSTGAEGTGNVLISSNYIPVIGGSSYYVKCPSAMGMLAYDSNHNHIGNYVNGSWTMSSGTNVADRIITMAQNIAYVKFTLTSGYGTTYNHDICINVSNADINGTYFPHALQSAGSVTDVDTATELSKNLGVIDLGKVSFNYQSGSVARFASSNSIPNIKQYPNRTMSTLLTPQYKTYSSGGGVPNIDKICYTSYGQFLFHDFSKTDADLVDGKAPWLDGCMLVYELATPVVVPHDTPMQYAVDKYSTEELLVPASVAGEPTSTAIVADIEYQAK